MGQEMKLVITLGDPLSINIYAVCTLLLELSLPKYLKICLIGSKKYFDLECKKHHFSLPSRNLNIEFIDVGDGTPGQISTQSILESSKIPNPKVIISCPINKNEAMDAGFSFPGHTEYYAHSTQSQTLMLMMGLQPKKMFVGLCTNHLAINKISENLSIEKIIQKTLLLNNAIKKIGKILHPPIAICGLNPHCSDQGSFGHEEKEIIEPSIKILKETYHINVFGPVSADTVFYLAYKGNYDGVLAMYHDQGLIPIKTLSFNHCVNITYNLPFLRMSPDHGPGRDLYLKEQWNKVELGSFRTCFELAMDHFRNSL